MQEYPKLLSSDQPVGITQLPSWLAMSPVKNNIKDALVKFQKVGCADCASSGEANMYFANRQYMREAGVKLTEGEVIFLLFLKKFWKFSLFFCGGTPNAFFPPKAENYFPHF